MQMVHTCGEEIEHSVGAAARVIYIGAMRNVDVREAVRWMVFTSGLLAHAHASCPLSVPSHKSSLRERS